jgi:hypothetical protein
MAPAERFAILVLGSGQSGKLHARSPACSEKKVATVKRQWVGGPRPAVASLHSKNEMWSARIGHLASLGEPFRTATGAIRAEIATALHRKQIMIERVVAFHLKAYKDSGAKLIMGCGHFVTARTIEASFNRNGTRLLSGTVCGQYFILTRQEIDAETAKEWGVVYEVVSPDKLLPRAREITEGLGKLPPLTSSYTHIASTREFRWIIDEGVDYGFALDGIIASDAARPMIARRMTAPRAGREAQSRIPQMERNGFHRFQTGSQVSFLKTYDCYFIDRTLRPLSCDKVRCVGDQAAMLVAGDLLRRRSCSGVEVWDRGRYVGRLLREMPRATVANVTPLKSVAYAGR